MREKKGQAAKAERLAAALRANLKRRKAQVRAKSQPEGDGASPRPTTKPPKTRKNPA